jgi:hypothetical protein
MARHRAPIERRARLRLVIAGPAAIAAATLSFAACDEPARDEGPRFNYPVDAPEEDTFVPAVDAFTPPRDASVDGLVEADAEAGPPPQVVRAIATGSGEHPDPLVGNGDHTCVIAGPTRSLYCWGANDHGQLGNGKTGAGAFTEDVATATKIALDETGLPFEGLEEVSLAAWHSCARKGDVLFCWGERFTGAQAEPPAPANLDRTAPRAIGNFDVVRGAAGVERDGPALHRTDLLRLSRERESSVRRHARRDDVRRPREDDVRRRG